MTPQFDDALLKRYRGFVALASRGEGGEKDNANRLAERMKSRHPGIHIAAFPPHPPEEEEEGYIPSPNLRDIFERVASQMRTGASWAAHAAYEAMQIDTARRAAEETVELRSKILASNKWQVAAKIPLDQLELLAEDLTSVQAEVFADTVADSVREEVLAALGYELE